MKDFFALKQENIFQFIYQQFCLQIGITRIIHPTQHPKTWGITIGFGLFFLITFYGFRVISEEVYKKG